MAAKAPVSTGVPSPTTTPAANARPHKKKSPSRIPYFVVWSIIILALLAFVFLRTTEQRPEILRKGREIPPVIAQYIPLYLLPLAHSLFYISPFSIHPLSFVSFLFLATCLMTTLYRVRNTDPGIVTPDSPVWGPDADASTLNCIERKANGAPRYCRKTGVFKPDRAHYCRATNRVVLRYDHYCIFVDASIGHNNHKYFILFLVHTHLTAMFIALSCFFPLNFIIGLSGSHLATMFVVFVATTAVSLSVLAFLGFHLFLLINGTTTLEYTEKQGQLRDGRVWQSPYKVHPLLCLAQVMGYDVLWWGIPTAPELRGDGTVFPIRSFSGDGNRVIK